MSRPLRYLSALLLGGALTAVACLGCQDHGHPHEGSHPPHDEQGGHEEEHGHEHEGDAIGITRFSEKLELFAEHPPAVTGEELPFLAHLTVLDGFRALEDATVTLVLEGPSTVEARVTEPLRPGIFRPTLVAPAPGTYRGRLLVAGPEAQGTLDDFEVVVYPDADTAARAAASEEASGPEPIPFLKEQQWQVPFATAFAERGAVVPAVEVSGEITTPPNGQAEVGAAVAGRIMAPRDGLPHPGQAVRRGELLATLAPTPASPEAGAQAELAVVEAEARAQAARAALERGERLIADRAIPERQVEEARRELRVAEEAVLAARRARDIFSGAARGSGSGTYRVTAPIDGVVVEVAATAGQSVASGEHLFRIVSLDELWIRARVPEQQAALIRTDHDAAFLLPGLATWLPLRVTGEDANASVIDVGRMVDRRSRTVDVLYALRAPDARLRVGAMVRVSVPAGEPWEGVVVPRGAVLDADGQSVIYVQVDGEAFEERTVRVGPRAGDRVGIVAGLREGERVVTIGANVIRLAARAATAPAHGHVH